MKRTETEDTPKFLPEAFDVMNLQLVTTNPSVY